MAARPPVANTLQMRIQYLVGDKIAENVLHWTYAPGGPAPLLFVEDVAGNADTYLSGTSALWGATTSYTSTTVVDLNNDTGFSAVADTATAGTRGGEIITSMTAILASYSVARRYRGGHPRTYLPWMTNADILTPQSWIALSVTEAQTAWAGFITNVKSSAAGAFTITNQVQVSYTLAGVPRVTPITDALTFSQCQAEIASQRRRDGRH